MKKEYISPELERFLLRSEDILEDSDETDLGENTGDGSDIFGLGISV